MDRAGMGNEERILRSWYILSEQICLIPLDSAGETEVDSL